MLETIARKVLVVDDEEEIVELLGNILKRAHYDVVTATLGRKAVELTRQIKPDIILLDVLLPDIQGGQVAAELSLDPATSEIPIVFVTGVMSADAKDFLGTKLGKYFLMLKPVSEKDILKKVSEVLALKATPQ
ncbi:MAG: response regulator [Candidatus Omnitrophota bacterium]